MHTYIIIKLCLCYDKDLKSGLSLTQDTHLCNNIGVQICRASVYAHKSISSNRLMHCLTLYDSLRVKKKVSIEKPSLVIMGLKR